MSPKDLLKQIQISKTSISPQWIGLRQVSETTTYRSARDGQIEHNSASTSKGTMVEVLVDGQFGYAATSDASISGIQKAFEQAYSQAKSASLNPVYRFTPAERPATQTQYRSPVKKTWDSVSTKELVNQLIRISQRMKRSEEIVQTRAVIQYVHSHHHSVSTSEADIEQTFFLTSHDFEATAQKGPITQKRTPSGFFGQSFQGGFEYFLSPNLDETVDRVTEQALELVHAPECPTGVYDLVIMPDQMMLQIHESIGHPLELDRILGDERNYAGWSFVKPQDFGSLQYGSALMNVSFDPTVPHEYASYAADDIGNPAKKEYLIQNGKLIRGLGSLESQKRLNLPGVANMRSSSWNRAPIDRMANLNLEPGKSSFAEIISSVKQGVLMESNRSWSIDDFRNKFQFGCEYGKWIENGQIKHTVRNPGYRGVTVPFWNSLKMLGSPETFGVFGTPHCGKGEPNQAIRVGHASPICLFSNIEVFGGNS